MEQKSIDIQEVLEIGNHDSLLLFGSDVQRELNEVSKMLASMVMKSDVNIEDLIQNLISEITDFQNQLESTSNKCIPWLKKGRKEKAIRKYSGIIVYIDKVELLLKIQETQLIKESKILEKLELTTEEAIQTLEQITSYAEKVLRKKQFINTDDNNLEEWYVRLTKKIDDLKISHTLAIQSKTQVIIMRQNARQLIDKIIVAISGTIPIWRNQVSLLLEVQKLNENKLLQVNETFKNSLDELLETENKEINARKEIMNSCL